MKVFITKYALTQGIFEAEAMRIAKINSLRKSIVKLERLKF